jgi:tetratricopeptide (TPR) repeat protein
MRIINYHEPILFKEICGGALDEAKEELKLYPDSTSTYYILGLTYGYMNRNHEAIDAFSIYIDSFPEAWAPRNDKAWLQFRIGDIDEALETMRPIVDNFKYTVWVQNTYCALLISKKDFSNAKTACERAQESINKMDENDWGRAYPGNDPRIYRTGLNAMKRSIDSNLAIINKNLSE